MRTIAIMNVKGGVGKTVTTVNLATILAEFYNQRVLVIDADPQADTSAFLGASDPEQAGLPPLAALLAMYVGFCSLGVAGMLLFPVALLFIKQLHDAGYLRLWK